MCKQSQDEYKLLLYVLFIVDFTNSVLEVGVLLVKSRRVHIVKRRWILRKCFVIRILFNFAVRFNMHIVFLIVNSWEKPHVLFGQLLDWIRWLVAWQPLILFLVQGINWFLGLE